MGNKKGCTIWNKGRTGIYSEETLEKMRSKKIGRKLSKEHIKNMCGKIPWNKGVVCSDNTKEKISNANRGRIVPKETKEKMRAAAKKRYASGFIHPLLGKKHSEEWNKKIGNGNRGKIISAETKVRMKVARAKRILPFKDTSIEVKVQNLLKQLGIEFATHQYMKIKYGYQCDIFIPVQKGITQKIVIECDGDYWHGNLEIFSIKNMAQHIKVKRCLDHERTAQLEAAGFRVIRLWENEIREMDENKFQERLLIAC